MIRRDHFKEYSQEKSETINGIIEVAITLEKQYLEKQDNELVSFISSCLEIESLDNLDDRFNVFYRAAMMTVAYMCFDPSIIIDMPGDLDIFQPLKKYSKTTREYLAGIYARTFSANLENINKGAGEILKTIDHLNLEGKQFNTEIEKHYSVILSYYVRAVQLCIQDAIGQYEVFTDKSIQKETENMVEFYQKAKERSKEVEGNPKLMENFSAEYAKDNPGKIDKYILIASWICAHLYFSQEKFNSALRAGFVDQSKDQFDIERIYLISILKKDSQYNDRRRAILDLIAKARKDYKEINERLAKNKKELEELYKSNKSETNDEDQLLDLIKKTVISK